MIFKILKRLKWKKITKIYLQIRDVRQNVDGREKIANVNCKTSPDSNDVFQRSFPFCNFPNSSEMRVDDEFTLEIFERPGEVRFVFSPNKEKCFDLDSEDIDISDLDNSPIFDLL